MKKNLSAVALFALVLWIGTALSGFIHAQNANEAPGPQPEATGQHLNDDTLKQVLDNMGFEPKKLNSGYLLSLKQDTWTLHIQVVLSPDTRKVGLNANLGNVSDPAKITASQWEKLLVSNGKIDPSAFYFDEEQKKLYLHRSFDNRSITAAVMRKEIESFSANLRTTADLWKFVE